MADAARFSAVGEKAYLVLVEVKKGEIRLNGPWTARERRNMLRVLRAVGPLPEMEAHIASNALYESGEYNNQLYRISLLCMGGQVNEELRQTHPAVPQIVWPECLEFIYSRFQTYRNEKRSHSQWDIDGKNLWNASTAARSPEAFVSDVQVVG
ncbi:MAG: hypothetical protein ABIW79_05265 [Gemmatimonas sp.]